MMTTKINKTKNRKKLINNVIKVSIPSKFNLKTLRQMGNSESGKPEVKRDKRYFNKTKVMKRQNESKNIAGPILNYSSKI